MALGWVAGYGYFVAYMTCCTSSHRPTDQQAMLFWTAVFAFVSWLLIALPVALFVRRASPVFTVHFGPFIGAVIGVLAFLVLLGWTGFWRETLYVAYAAVVGAVAGFVYAVLVRTSP